MEHVTEHARDGVQLAGVTHEAGAAVVAQRSAPKSIGRTVLIVHGRDEGAKESVARVISNSGLEPVILAEQPNQGMTLIRHDTHRDVGAVRQAGLCCCAILKPGPDFQERWDALHKRYATEILHLFRPASSPLCRAIAFKFAFVPQPPALDRNDVAHSAEHLAIGSYEPVTAILCITKTQYATCYCRMASLV